MACIPAGEVVRGSDQDDHMCEQPGRRIHEPPNARPAGVIWLDTYYMDRYEVTVEEYRACVAAGQCVEAGPIYEDCDRPRQPILGVSWFDAVKYCQVQGKHLPTEAQWEKAARGPDSKPYPWGDDPPTCERAVIRDDRGRSCGVRQQSNQPEAGRPNEVGSRPPGFYGLHDMIGNAEEWVYDTYSINYAACGESCLGPNPDGPHGTGEPRRVLKGGSWYWGAEHATAFHRRPQNATNLPYHHYGFRCAASVEEARALAAK
jgi:formylglycine-generating enzyme required for sulfatase activity